MSLRFLYIYNWPRFFTPEPPRDSAYRKVLCLSRSSHVVMERALAVSCFYILGYKLEKAGCWQQQRILLPVRHPASDAATLASWIGGGCP